MSEPIVSQVAVVAQVVATLMAIWALYCRINKMNRHTPREVRHQHAVLLGFLVFSLVLPGAAGAACVAVGVAAFLAYSTHRWRGGAPGEVASKPAPFDDKPHHWAADRVQ